MFLDEHSALAALRSGVEERYEGHNLVFVVGSPRSGTTWVQRLLACHPRIHTGQESDIFDLYVGPQIRAWRHSLEQRSGSRGVGLSCYMKEEEFMRVIRAYTLRLLHPLVGGLPAGHLFLEKTPSHALYIREIAELLPESRFLHVLRDGRDVVSSILAASRTWGSEWAPRDPVAAAHIWMRHVRAAREAMSTLPQRRIVEIRYEDLFDAPVVVLRQVASFLDVPWEPEQIEEAVSMNDSERARNGGGTPIPLGGERSGTNGAFVREPTGFVRKARPHTWREDLSLRNKVLLWRTMRRVLDEVGYGWRHPWAA